MNRNIMFLTNLPAPYRFPIWNSMSQCCNLEVIFIHKERNYRNWPKPSRVEWRYRFLNRSCIRFGEFEFTLNFLGSRKILKGVDVAVIGSWEIPIYIATILKAKRLNIPIVQFYESTSLSQKFRSGIVSRIRSYLLKQSAIIVTFGVKSTQAVVGMGIERKAILELYNVVDVNFFHEFAMMNRKLSSLGHRFLYVGQLIERKNVKNIIEAFYSICETEDSLTIAGDGVLRKELTEIVDQLNLRHQVFFVGHKNLNDLAAIYSESHTLVLASTNEVWGLVVNEALASGMHAVISDVCGVAEEVKEMKGTFICDTSSNSIGFQMARSRATWCGPIEQPEIIEYTPVKFATELMNRIDQVITGD